MEDSRSRSRVSLAGGGIFALLLLLLGARPALAAGSLYVSVVGSDQATVTLVAPDGSTQVERVTTGSLAITPKAGAGAYKVTIAVGDQSASSSVDVPTSGQVTVIYDPHLEQKIQVYVSAVEEITVTSQRVEESLQKIPVAVTALTAREMELNHMVTMRQVAEQTPNLFLENNTGLPNGARATIRGVGEDESFFTADTPVGIYIDDMYIPRQTGAMFDLYDAERIEVLRGPQGTLYGRNTSAGAIRLVTRQPGDQLRANVEGTLGEFSRADLKGSIGAPLGDKASFLIGGLRRSHDGYDRNKVNGAKVNDQDLWGGRAALRVLPSSKFNIVVTGDLIRDDSQPAFPVAFVPQPPFINSLGQPSPTGFGVGRIDFNQQLDGDPDVHSLASDLTSPISDMDQTGVSGVMTWVANERLLVKSITGYRKLDDLLLLDADGRVGNFLGLRLPSGDPAPSFHLFQDQHQKQFSEELQVQGTPSGSFRYIAGFYYFHEENRQRTENIIFAALGSNNFWDTTLDTDSVAGFGSATIRAADRLTLTVGARYTHDSKDFDTIIYRATRSFPQVASPSQQLIACVGPSGQLISGTRACLPTDPAGSTTTPVEKHLDDTWSAFTPRFALDYEATPEVLLYVSASRGFKSGAFDGRANTAATVLPLKPINPETLWSYELGVKSDWFRNRFRLNVAAFLNDWNDLQGSGTDPSGNFIRFSVGDVQTKGLEFEGKVVPTPGLEFSGQLGLLDTSYQEKNFNQAVDCAPVGTQNKVLELKGSPHHSYRLAGFYTTPPAVAGGRFTFGGAVSGKSKFFHATCNPDVGTEFGYTLVDASAAFETRDGRWRLTVAGDNLTDEEYLTGSFAIAGLRMSAGYINPRRRFSVTLRYAY